MSACTERITKLWKRIDFGPESLPINYDKLESFIKENKGKFNKYLKPERVEMLELITQYFKNQAKPKDFKEFGRLTMLVRSFRIATASHMGVQGISPLEELRACRTKKITNEINTNGRIVVKLKTICIVKSFFSFLYISHLLKITIMEI